MRFRDAAVVLAVALAGRAAESSAGADAGLRQAFERARYALQDSGQGTYRGENPAQRLTLEFDGRGAKLSHPDGSVSFHLRGYGYGERMREPPAAAAICTGNRVEYRRGDLSEWYVNGSQGLEQGFTIARRPGTDGAGGPLVIALGVSGSLAPVQKAGDGAVLFGAVLRYAGLRAVDARGRVVPSRLEARGGEIRLIVEDRDAQYPLVVDPTWTEQQELTASDGAANDTFGFAVSVDGNTAVIGALEKNGYQGAAYVFVRSAGVWTQQQELTASDGVAGDRFGVSVSVSGDTALIGASYKVVNNPVPGGGAAYVFVRSGGVWTQQQELTASNGAWADGFGGYVSVSGDTAAIGATGANNSLGAAYVFARSGEAWSQQQELTAFDGAAYDKFGSSVAVGGDTAVIAAFGRGAAYVFVRTSAAWSLQQELTPPQGTAPGGFGESVSVSGDTLAVGAGAANNYQGIAYIFVRSAGAWSQQQELTASDGAEFDGFGDPVAVSGDTAVIGAYGKNGYRGAAYVFVRSGGVWSQQQELTAADGAADNQFGVSISMSGDTVVIGANGHAVNAQPYQGAAYAFVFPRLGTNSLLVGSAGGASSVVLAYDGAWTATSNSSFLHISPGSASGSGSQVVVFTYDPFTIMGSRTGTLTIAGLTVTVTQGGTNYVSAGPVTLLPSSGPTGPVGLAVDSAGNVYIADRDSGDVKEWIAATQQMSTLVPSGLYGPIGLALDSSGNVYFADGNQKTIEEWSAATSQVSPLVTLSQSSLPYGVAVDRFGNVYIADYGNGAILEWSAAAGQVSTLLSAGLKWPFGAAVDGLGNVYVADSGNNAIKEWSAATSQVIPLVSSGLNSPSGVAVDGSGNVYIADTNGYAIRQWSAATGQVSTLLASGLNGPEGVAVDGSGNVYIADTFDNAVKEIPNALVGPASVTEGAPAGSDSLFAVIPTTTNLTGVFAPSSDQSWLTIGAVANGVVDFSFTANTSTAPRVAHISLLGRQIPVTQLAPQTIAFGPLPNQLTGSAPFTIGATASSGLPVSFNSQTTGVCTVSGSTVTLVSAGTCTIQATQAGNATYEAAWPVLQSFQVAPGGVSLVMGTGSAPPGQTAQAPIQLASIGTDVPSTFQADLSFDTTKLTFMSASAGAQLTGASKSLSTHTLANGDVRLLAAGLNQTTIPSGVVVNVSFELNPAFTWGNSTVTLKNCAAADSQGNLLFTACTPGTIVAFTCDLNGDGQVNVADVQVIINEALGVIAAVHDLNHDGVVNVGDVQKEINAALGLGCPY